MAQKHSTITVSAGWYKRTSPGEEFYRVEKLTDSVEFTPHQFLTKAGVEELCSSKQWTVHVVAKPKG